MNGNINLYAGGRNRTGLETEASQRVEEQKFTAPPSYNDGKIEFATFDSLLLYILNVSNSITQEEGPFEFDFNSGENINTFVNIDGEFYKVFSIEKIKILKGESL